MLDEKRLAEVMQPEKMRELADFLDRVNVGGELGWDRDALDCAAAVLRKVAEPGASTLSAMDDKILAAKLERAELRGRRLALEESLIEDKAMLAKLHTALGAMERQAAGASPQAAEKQGG